MGRVQVCLTEFVYLVKEANVEHGGCFSRACKA